MIILGPIGQPRRGILRMSQAGPNGDFRLNFDLQAG